MTVHCLPDSIAFMTESWVSKYLNHVKMESGRSLSSIAREIGVASTTLTRPANDPEHKYDVKTQTLESVREATGIDFEPFRHGQTIPHAIPNGAPAPAGSQLVPVFNVEASAGDGSFVQDEYQVASLSFPEGYLSRITRANPRDLAVISVKGDSMIPTLADDDVVMLDVTKKDLSFDGLFVIRDNGDALLVKRIGRASRSGHVSVISDNREHYPPVERALDDIEVIGKVIWKGGKV